MDGLPVEGGASLSAVWHPPMEPCMVMRILVTGMVPIVAAYKGLPICLFFCVLVCFSFMYKQPEILLLATLVKGLSSTTCTRSSMRPTIDNEI